MYMDTSERSSRKHQRPRGGSKGAPIVLMMLPYGARARARRTPASCAELGRDFALGRQILWTIIAGRFLDAQMRETGVPLCV